MPTYDPQIVISAAPGITQYLRLALFEATAPNTEVAASAQLAPPHTASRQLVFTGLNPVIHLSKLYITDGISTTGTVIANFELDPKYPGVEIKADWFIYAGTTTGFAVGDNKFTDPTGELTGWDYTVDIRGFGKLDPDSEVNTALSPAGYEVLLTDYQTNPGECHIISFAPKMITYNTSSNPGGALFSSVEVITADRALLGTEYGVMFLCQSATGALTVTLPEMAATTANKLFFISSQGGSHKNVTVEVENLDTDKIQWLGGDLLRVYLGQSEGLWVYKWVDPLDSNNQCWRVANDDTAMNNVGEIFQYLRNSDLVNAVFANGAELDRDVYPRLWAHVQALDPTMLVTDAVWGTGSENKSRFSTGDGSTTFRLPLLYTPGFLRGVDGSTRKALSIEAEEVGELDLDIELREGSGGSSTGPLLDKGFSGQDNAAGWLANGAAGAEKYIKVYSNGTETRPANTSVYLLIRT